MVYRMFCLQSHYRKNLVFSYENLDNATIAYRKLIQKIAALKGEGDVDAEALSALKAKFAEALDNDLNTSLAITALYDVLKAKCSDATKRAAIADFDRVLSLNLIEAADALRAAEEKAAAEAAAAADALKDDFDREIEALIAQRAAAKKEKNFAEADRIRAYLAERGVTLKDSSQGTTYERT
jgi:cysteinyl-tRNA synthetase